MTDHHDSSIRMNGFLAMHKAGAPLLMANAFDLGTARMLASLGFRALATTSGGFAGTLGRVDGSVTRDEAISHAGSITRGVDIPVSADLENGFGHDPADVAKTVHAAIDVGLSGCSIEDYGATGGDGIYEFDKSVERIAAAVNAIRQRDTNFVLTARCENFLRGRADFIDTCRRLLAYQSAGADVLMAPALPDLASVETVCTMLDHPFSFMVGMPGKSFMVNDLASAGVARISLATSLYRAAMNGVLEAAREVLDEGTFEYVDRVVSSAELTASMDVGPTDDASSS